VLAVHTPLGPIGVAYGTLVAQYSGLVLAVMILWLKYHLQSTRAELRAALRWDRMRRLMQLNGNLFIRSLCFMVVYVGFTSLASKYGDTELAVSAILMKLFMLFSYFVDGFAFAGEALVGRYIGERAPRMTRRAVRLLFNWSLGVGLIFTAVYALWGDDCIRLITTDMMVIDGARSYMAWLIAMPIVSTLAFMWDGVYVGATAGIQIRNSMIWAAVAFVGAYLACYRWIGVQAIYVAYFAHLLARVVYLSIQWKPLFNSIQQDA
jgi:MATE family multidrug resistance protein